MAVTILWAVMLCGWEANRRSGITLAMYHRLSGISTYGLNGLEKRDEHSEYYSIFTFTFLTILCLSCVDSVCTPVRWTSRQDIGKPWNIRRPLRTSRHKAVHSGVILLRAFQVDIGPVYKHSLSCLLALVLFVWSFCSSWSCSLKQGRP